nr:class I tRNA ligase family protein [bacterium]
MFASFLDRTSKVITGNFVTLDTGSGCVHIAPGHGEDDYIAGKEHGLPTISPVDNSGRFTSEFELMKGENVFKANPKVIDLLKSKSALIGEPENIEHSYPHCWRCKKPIIFRATYQWFLNIEHLNLRQNLLNAIQNDVNWVPNWGQDRIKAMVTLRPDWCLSRQRIWGVPIPVMYCSDCNTPLIDKTNIEFFKKLVEKHGVDCWFTMKPNDLLPEGAKCSKCGGKNFTKETDILDVWFDSGASHIAVLEKRDYLSSPADLYLEGSDQHRGWFQLSLIPSIATRNRAPFKTVLTHGFVVDGNGKKMSKSEGNVIAPQEIISKYGADILRLWTAYEDYRNDVSIGKNIVDRLVEAYKKIRNTLRFLLSNLNDFNFQKDKIEYSKLADIDKWMLAELFELSNKINLAYEEFRFHSIYHLIYGFCIKELSSFYLDVLKERLYLSGPDSLQRRSAQTVLFEILRALTHFIAPILSYTAEETAKFYPDITDNKDSIFLSQWPVLDKQFDNSEVINNWKEIINFREDATKAQEIARNSKSINQSLESKIIVYIKSEKNFNLFSKLKDEIRAALICSELEINLFDEDSKIDYDYDG